MFLASLSMHPSLAHAEDVGKQSAFLLQYAHIA